ncbi:homoserine O-acetyltransferase [Fistulina hepatica ATCC 64428]|nr:homoserine O-acetyltransferase [Fistulina hepatica ATCC 64428]
MTDIALRQPLSALLDQEIYHVPLFTLECGTTMRNVPVAYKTWGRLNTKRDNVMVICHALTGSSDVEDWWGPLMGRGKAFDPQRFFIICMNVLGSPYGSASPLSLNPDTGRPYGPEFPPTTIRDDVLLHKRLLDHLGVASIAVVIGGSMGGMAVLEWPLCTPPGYVRHIVPLATSARHSAWCISWGEAQRQSIYSDPLYAGGFYTQQPVSGLAAARMAALLTYRSRDSFERRFGRNQQASATKKGVITPPQSPVLKAVVVKDPETEKALAHHNDGHRALEEHFNNNERAPIFSAQSYLRYQGDKFTARFDANCYIHLTRKMDTHDVARGRGSITGAVLARLPPRALIISIATDGLFTPSEQEELARYIPCAELVVIASSDGHDGFLLEFEQINLHILRFLKRQFPEVYASAGPVLEDDQSGFEIKKTSLFGEAEAGLAQW